MALADENGKKEGVSFSYNDAGQSGAQAAHGKPSTVPSVAISDDNPSPGNKTPQPDGGGGGGYSGGGSGGGGYSGGGYGGAYASDMYGDPNAILAQLTPASAPNSKANLLNTEANAQANKDMLKLAGYDLENPPAGLTVPGQVALPNTVALPNVALPNYVDNPNVALPQTFENPNVALPKTIDNPNVALPEWIALSDNVDLPNRLDLPEGVNLPEFMDFETAMKQAGVDIGRVDNINIDQEKAMLDQIAEAQRQQAILNSDRAVQTGTADLQRNLQNAQEQFNAQKNQIDIDEQRAKDNQALYSEARGDRGGIGQAQYDTIQNTAATNRLMVQKEQTQLATDTARQIADLRSQGEFEKANQLLSISQNYLSQLMDLYTWAKEANIGIDEFNLQVAQWEENYKLSLVDAQLDVQNSNLNIAQAMMQQQMNLYNAAYQQEIDQYNAKWNQATTLWNQAYQQANSQYEAAWNQAQQKWLNEFNQEQANYQNAYQQAQQNWQNAFNQEQANYQNAWNQAQQLWQNEYQQENSLYNAAWNQATDLFNAAYNQENSQFDARRAVSNDYFNNQLNAANYGLNASRAALEAQLNAAQATGAFANGTPTYAAQQDTRQILAASGQALLEKGIIPTAEQLEAMGMTSGQAAQLAILIATQNGTMPGVSGDYISGSGHAVARIANAKQVGTYSPIGGVFNTAAGSLSGLSGLTQEQLAQITGTSSTASSAVNSNYNGNGVQGSDAILRQLGNNG